MLKSSTREKRKVKSSETTETKIGDGKNGGRQFERKREGGRQSKTSGRRIEKKRGFKNRRDGSEDSQGYLFTRKQIVRKLAGKRNPRKKESLEKREIVQREKERERKNTPATAYGGEGEKVQSLRKEGCS